MSHRGFLLMVLVILTLSPLIAVTVQATSSESGTPTAVTVSQHEQGLPEGISLDILADGVVNNPAPAGAVFLDLRLERVPLAYGAALKGRERDTWLGDPFTRDSTHLLYVESGEVTLVTGQGEHKLAAGGEALVLADEAYELRSDGGCASLLRLSFAINPGGRGAWAQGPGPRTNVCGAPQILFARTDPWPTTPPMQVPLRVFISRITWDARIYQSGDAFGTAATHVHAGPVALLVESGGLLVKVGARPTESYLPPGGSITIQAGVPHGERPVANRTVALMAGVVAADRELWASFDPCSARDPTGANEMGTICSPHESQNYGYALSWDETWAGRDLTREDRHDWFRFGNGTGAIWVEAYDAYDGDSERCLEAALDEVRADPGVGQVTVVERLDGADAANALLTVIYPNAVVIENPDEGEVEVAEYLECRTLVPSEAVLKIHMSAPLDQWGSQIAELQEFLAGIVLQHS